MVDDGVKRLIFLNQQLEQLLIANNNQETIETSSLRSEIERLSEAQQKAKNNSIKFFS
jgi:hypothetical protein